jgi:hypothetical protein
MSGITGCIDENFLEKYPLTAITPETYFNTGNDYKLYVNQFYDVFPVNTKWDGWDTGPTDLGTDNEIGSWPSTRLNGQQTKTVNDANWTENYKCIRNVNIMLNRTSKANQDEIAPYVAEGHFFRAWFYYELLKRFGGVPVINNTIDLKDEETLKTPRSSRNVVVNNIVADLDHAIANLPPRSKAELFRINKETALAFKSRVCLYEGTWEKYHGKKGSPFKVDGSDGTVFLQQAMDAALQIMNSGEFDIYKTGAEPYFDLFNRHDYSSVKEVIFWRSNDKKLLMSYRSAMIRWASGTGGLTKNLIEDFLSIDGLPVSLSPLFHADDSLTVLFQNRDPRLKQMIWYPDMPASVTPTGEVEARYTFVPLTSVPTGYHHRKHASVASEDWKGDNLGYIYFRYGEVLLNYIEAKAELFESGKASLSQNDFDISINKLRNRVDMAPFVYGTPIVDPTDEFTGKIPWYLVEIRRERRIELAIETLRLDDIFRWAAADELIKGKIYLGAPYQWYVDRKWYAEGQIKGVNAQGLLSPWYNTEIDKQGGFNFNLGRDYLYPLPIQEVTLAGYPDNPGW